MARETGRDRTLAQLVAHVRAHGLPDDPSLRHFAEHVGTSHRMLAYYFGSRDGLLAEVLAALRADEREGLWSTARSWSLRDATLAMWAHYTDPARLPEHQVFFALYARALRQPEKFTDFLAGLDAWVEMTTDLAVAEGTDAATARRRAQLVVSAMRGLLLDRLAAGEPEQVDRAFELLVDELLPAPRTAVRRARVGTSA